MSARNAIRLLALGAVLAVAALVSIAVGAAELPLTTVLEVLRGGGDEEARIIVINLRMPRAMLAMLVGSGLGISGAVFQALLRNP